MPSELFTEFYKARKNLKLLEKEIPKMRKISDSLKKNEVQKEQSYLEEIDLLNEKTILLDTSSKKCNNLLVSYQLENYYLSSKLMSVKKTRKTYIILGFCVGAVSLLILQ
jgi:hypothetical protein